MSQSKRKRSRRSSDPDSERLAGNVPFRGHDMASAFAPKRKQPPFLFRSLQVSFLSPFGYFRPVFHNFVSKFRPVTGHWLWPFYSAVPEHTECVVVLGVYLPRPSTHFKPALYPSFIYVAVSHVVPLTVELSQTLPEDSRIDEVDVSERSQRQNRNADRHDGRTSAPTAVVPGDGGHDPGSVLGGAEAGNTFVTNGLNARTGPKAKRRNPPAAMGFYRARKSSRTIGSLPLGSSDEMETLVVGSPATEQRDIAGNHRGETEEGNREDGKRDECGNQLATNINPGALSDGGGLNSNSQRGRHVWNDRCEGAYVDRDSVQGLFS